MIHIQINLHTFNNTTCNYYLNSDNIIFLPYPLNPRPKRYKKGGVFYDKLGAENPINGALATFIDRLS